MSDHAITAIRLHAGTLGLCACPGAHGALLGRAEPDAGIDALARWPATAVVTLMETRELEMLGLGDLPRKLRERLPLWLHLPIRDGDIPGRQWMERWQVARLLIAAVLAEGGRVAVHCLAGVGRTGTVASMCLVDAGFGDGAESLSYVRRLHHVHAAETPEQEAFVGQYSPEFTINKQTAHDHLAEKTARAGMDPVIDENGRLIRKRARTLI
ncbi:phosphatase domain-containing putative toxin [Wenzhouxiangella sp. EGI_FJ10409]|uniref:phosphatase domain-containing putative toxin n=1 Tax=Wenzhouxiangella sp. EGI_FJ10409 TaxID=3243767 RepID=UPI0035E2F487